MFGGNSSKGVTILLVALTSILALGDQVCLYIRAGPGAHCSTTDIQRGLGV